MKRARYIVIEGPIGVGKTTLSHRLAASLDARVLLESPEENPFLGPFYDDPAANALPAQLFFLLQRTRQIQGLRQADLFARDWVADFMFDKDPLFAGLNLSDPELALYRGIYERLSWRTPAPDRVIYLHAPVVVLMERIRQRARPAERLLDPAYLSRVAGAYAEFFRDYDAAPLVTVDAARFDLVNREEDYRRVLAMLDAV
jgi:deoxyadenosine/deoxycytidine kinase